MREQTALLLFLNHCFGSMEVQLCRDQVKRLVSLSMWISLQEGMLLFIKAYWFFFCIHCEGLGQFVNEIFVIFVSLIKPKPFFLLLKMQVMFKKS